MIDSVLLRFRDLLADTISEHSQIIERSGYVWWGWWRKPDEPLRLGELEYLSTRVQGEPLAIGIFDRSTPRYFLAITDQLHFGREGEFIPTPDLSSTPEYYRTSKVPAWFRLRRISPLSEKEFTAQFLGIPSHDHTLFPISGPIEPTSKSVDRTPLKGNVLIHLSDIHFGSDFGFPATAAPGSVPLPQILTHDLRNQVGDDAGLLVVSGDLTSRGDASYLFSNALPFLENLSTALKLKRQQVVVIPGNHDICLRDFTLTYDHERAFVAFLNEFYGGTRTQMELLRFTLPDGRPLDVFTINSVKLRSQGTSNYGWVDWHACENFLDGFSAPDPRTLRIAVVHHHLVPAPREERLPDSAYPFGSVSVTLNSGAVIEGLQRYGFRAVLHGHQHTPALHRISRGRYQEGSTELVGMDEALYLVAGGSAGAAINRIDGEIRDNTYGILRIEQDMIRMKVRRYNPSGTVRDLHTARIPIS